MIPIYEQGKGNGIGHGFDSFSQRFDNICMEHIAEGRARAFAFIFYDFNDSDLRRILKNQGVFAKLDRLSGTQLSIFYLHTGKRAAISDFNKRFLSALGVTENANLPCVVFFNVKDNQVENIEIAQLESANLVHGFHELYSAIECYLASKPVMKEAQKPGLNWVKSSSTFVGLELFRAALKRVFEFIL